MNLMIAFLLLANSRQAIALSIQPSEHKTVWTQALKNIPDKDMPQSNFTAYIDENEFIKLPKGAMGWFLIDFNSTQKTKFQNKLIEYRSAVIEMQVDCSLNIQRTFSKLFLSQNMGDGDWMNDDQDIKTSWDYHHTYEDFPTTELIHYICDKKK